MGSYNPRAPYILGEEWVPIRDENLIFTAEVNEVEVGHGFTLATSRIPDNARFYINSWPEGEAVSNQNYMAAIYPRGYEDQSGPIESVIIPVNSVTATGATGTASPSTLWSPGDGSAFTFDVTATQTISCYFDVNRYPQLSNKRIVAVHLLYALSADTSSTPTMDPTLPSFRIQIQNDTATQSQLYGNLLSTNAVPGGNVQNIFLSDIAGPTINRLSMGGVSPWWLSAAFSSGGVKQLMPWTWDALRKLEASSASRAAVNLGSIAVTTTTGNLSLNYVALQVFYCEEQRLAVTAYRVGGSTILLPYQMATNVLPEFRSPYYPHTINPVLPAGNYLLTLSSPIVSTIANAAISPNLNALRQLYEIPPHPGVQVNIPFPIEDAVGDTFTSEPVMVLPQISVHASGGTLTEPHVYGRQVAAQVWGSQTATQVIYDDISGVSASYPWVRFYTRRFGDTTMPLTLTGAGSLSGSSVTITPAEWDDYQEIIDGWKEITLRFATPPAMGAISGLPAWVWSSANETAGNRWEILGASAPAISGSPAIGNMLNYVASPNALGTATYQPPTGTGVYLSWMPQGVGSAWVTGASIDQSSDAVLIFSQDPATITGVSLSQATQSVTGIGLGCNGLDCCIPSGIGYNALSWSPPAGGTTFLDTFSRAATGWGTPDSGPAWLDVGGTVEGDYITTGTKGTHVLTSANVSRRSVISGVAYTDLHIRVKASLNVVTAGASIRATIIGHFVDTSNYDLVDFRFAISGTLEIVIGSFTGGTQTSLTNINVGAIAANDEWYLDVDFNGTTVRAKAWPVNNPEPAGYQADAPAVWSTGGFGLRSIRTTGNTNSDAVMSYDDFTVTPSTWNFGAYEMQRWDTTMVGDDFETIMLATSAGVTSFKDFEARVGITSVYRIRMLNILNFAGPWSAMVSGAPVAPGVSGGGGCAMTGSLIFTSNADQTGANNAAYLMAWDNEPVEAFGLPEADMVRYQPVYGRDGSIAFHGTERGLETFTRVVQLQAAAISPVRLADAKTIRDLAWDDLPYVCVRDDIGDRWYSSVRVPNVNVRNVRTTYLARIEIVETNVSPYPVNP